MQMVQQHRTVAVAASLQVMGRRAAGGADPAHILTTPGTAASAAWRAPPHLGQTPRWHCPPCAQAQRRLWHGGKGRGERWGVKEGCEGFGGWGTRVRLESVTAHQASDRAPGAQRRATLSRQSGRQLRVRRNVMHAAFRPGRADHARQATRCTLRSDPQEGGVVLVCGAYGCWWGVGWRGWGERLTAPQQAVGCNAVNVRDGRRGEEDVLAALQVADAG